MFDFKKTEGLFTNIFYVGCSQPEYETRLAWINSFQGDNLAYIGRSAKSNKQKYEINCINEEEANQWIFIEKNNIGTEEDYLSIIKWIFKASMPSLNTEQVHRATKTIVQDCANQWLSSVVEYQLIYL